MHTSNTPAAQLDSPSTSAPAITEVSGEIKQGVQAQVAPMLSGFKEMAAMKGEAEALAGEAQALMAEVETLPNAEQMEGGDPDATPAELVQREIRLRAAASALHEKVNAALAKLPPLVRTALAPALAAGAVAPSILLAGEQVGPLLPTVAGVNLMIPAIILIGVPLAIWYALAVAQLASAVVALCALHFREGFGLAVNSIKMAFIPPAIATGAGVVFAVALVGTVIGLVELAVSRGKSKRVLGLVRGLLGAVWRKILGKKPKES